MTVKFPLVLSPSLGAGLPAASVPLAAAVQEPEVVPELKVQVRSAVSPGARLATLVGVKPPLQAPPPATFTFVIRLSPVFFSVTTTVMVAFGSTVVPGETLFVVSVVEGLMGP